jgi:hypothetical protein
VAKLAILLVLWATVIWRAPAIGRSASSRSLWLALACLALALTYDIPFVIHTLDSTTHVTDLATVVKHVLGLAACANLLDWIVASLEPEREHWLVRRRRLVATVTALGLIALFFCTPRIETADFAASAAGNTWAVSYLLVFELYLGFAMSVAFSMFVLAWKDTHSRFLRTGVALLLTGTAAGMLYAVARSVALIASLTTGSMPDGDNAATSLTDAVQVAAIALILLGLAVPPCEPGWRRAQKLRELLDLRSLWHSVNSAAPSTRLFDPPTLRQDVTSTDPGLHVVVRGAEIRDSTSKLREYVPASHWNVIQQRLDAAGLTGPQKDAAAEACWIGTAIRIKTQDVPNPDPAELPAPRGGYNVDQDLKWQRAVAKARRTRLVSDIDAHLTNLHPITAP